MLFSVRIWKDNICSECEQAPDANVTLWGWQSFLWMQCTEGLIFFFSDLHLS